MVIRGLAIIAGSNLRALAIIGSVLPTTFAMIIVINKLSDIAKETAKLISLK